MVSRAMARYAVELNAATDTEAVTMLESARWNLEPKRWVGDADRLHTRPAARTLQSIADGTYQEARAQLDLRPRSAR
jgi:hypothetical protein